MSAAFRGSRRVVTTPRALYKRIVRQRARARSLAIDRDARALSNDQVRGIEDHAPVDADAAGANGACAWARDRMPSFESARLRATRGICRMYREAGRWSARL